MKKKLQVIFLFFPVLVYSQIDSCFDFNISIPKRMFDYTCINVESQHVHALKNIEKDFFFPYVKEIYIYGLESGFFSKKVRFNKVKSLSIESANQDYIFSYSDLNTFQYIESLKAPYYDDRFFSQLDSFLNIKELNLSSNVNQRATPINKYIFYRNLSGLILSLKEFENFNITDLESEFLDSLSINVKSTKDGSKFDLKKFPQLRILQFNSSKLVNLDSIFINPELSTLTEFNSFNKLKTIPSFLLKLKKIEKLSLYIEDLDKVKNELKKINCQTKVNIYVDKTSTVSKNEIHKHFKKCNIVILTKK